VTAEDEDDGEDEEEDQMPFRLGARLLNEDVPPRIMRLAEAAAHPDRALRDFGGHKVREIKASFIAAPRMEAAPAGQPPRAHRRAFSKSIFYELVSGGQGVAIGSSDVRADLMQHGGVVRPVHASALAVPALEEDASLYGKRPRDVAGLEYVPLPQTGTGVVGVLIRGRMKGRGRKKRAVFSPAFWLYARVTIKKHPWVDMKDADWDYLGEALQRQTDQAVGSGQ
jgi:hypothetical protein